MPSSRDTLVQRLGLHANSAVLRVALTHSSYAAEHECDSNERLEFLGDAVVDLAIAELIVREHPALDEGTGSLVRAQVVNERALAKAATSLDLAKHLRVGRGEASARGTLRPSMLADAFEAIVAAVHLERGYEAAREFIRDVLGADLARAVREPVKVSPKSRLIEWAAANGKGAPSYAVSSSGPVHAPVFEAVVSVDGAAIGVGRGPSKRSAETEAARAAWGGRDDA